MALLAIVFAELMKSEVNSWDGRIREGARRPGLHTLLLQYVEAHTGCLYACVIRRVKRLVLIGLFAKNTQPIYESTFPARGWTRGGT